MEQDQRLPLAAYRGQGDVEAAGFQAIMSEAASLKVVERVVDVYSVNGAKRLDVPS